MPLVNEVFVPLAGTSVGTGHAASPQPSADTIRQLHGELAAIALPVAAADTGATPAFGQATAERLIRFQKRYGLPAQGNLDPTTGALLTLSALVSTETDPAKLRTALAGARNAVTGSAKYDQWLARFSVMAGAYDLAATVTPHLQDLWGNDIGGLLTDGGGNDPPRQPEVPFPENYYAFRYSLMAQADIDTLRVQRTHGAAEVTAYLARGISVTGQGSLSSGQPPWWTPPMSPTPPSTQGRQDRLANSAEAFLAAVEAWQLGNSELSRQRYDSATQYYDRCQQAVLDYFSSYPDYDVHFATPSLATRVDELLWWLASDPQRWADLWEGINWRRQLLSLAELGQSDWFDPSGPPPFRPGEIVYQILAGNLAGSDQPIPATSTITPQVRIDLMDTRLVVIAAVLVPLARGEANRMGRQFSAVRDDLGRVLRTEIANPTGGTPSTRTVRIACEFMEIPFARLMLIESLIDEAEAQFQERAIIDDELDATVRADELAQLATITQDFTTRHIAGDPRPGAQPFQHLVAALTYARAIDAISDDGSYLARTKQALDTLQETVRSAVASGDVTSLAFRSLGRAITIPTVTAIARAPGSSTHPHEPYVAIGTPAQAMRERNPRVYALLLQAQSRLLQIWSGFNYLGYRDDFVPPWRFAYLLDRARYFADHAKNAERDYLNFLSNAENAELQERSAAQNVELEKANVEIDNARVDVATAQLAAAHESATLAALTASDAAGRLQKYKSFEEWSGGFDLLSKGISFGVGMAEALAGDPAGAALAANSVAGMVSDDQSRALEESNLKYAATEAVQAQSVAEAQVGVAQAGLVVAGLERQAGLLRHAFALQNLQFLYNRTLGSEQWYRMASAIRGVADIYLRRAIETAFLAQQAYNFESDKRLSVIRFDYALSDVGAMLAADFLSRDLDGLEQDLVSTAQSRRQAVRYVLSLSRDLPDALGTLVDDGSAIFGVRIEELERHFPGLIDLRIASVDVQLVALMDPTRVTAELTHLGTGRLRLGAQPGSSTLDVSDVAAANDWLGSAGTPWPTKIHVSGPETAVFSGLSARDQAAVDTITAAERGAFEGLAGASTWRLDVSARENQIVPGTLSDVVVTFVMTGTYDPGFKQVVVTSASAPRPFATTRMISARRELPDSYYGLAHEARAEFPIAERMLALTGTPNALRNLAVILPLVGDGPELGRCYCQYPVSIVVSSGAVVVETALPELTFTPNGLVLACAYTGAAGTDVTWDFGDGSVVVSGTSVQHTYARPGRYEVMTRLVRNGELFEYRSTQVLSAAHPMNSPLVVVPTFSAGTISAQGTVPVTISPPAALAGVSIDCGTGTTRKWAPSGPVQLDLVPGSYLVTFLAIRDFSGRLYARQRYLPNEKLTLVHGGLATNRTFDALTGTETTATPNAFSVHVFGSRTISPVDRWTLELPVADNPFLASVSSADVAEVDASELADAVLALEFLGTSG
jgi:hypothetical protein